MAPSNVGTDTHLQVNCPYCTQSWKGVDQYGWIKRHVAAFHSEKLEQFQTLSRKSYSEMVLTPKGVAKQKREEKLKKQKEEMMMEDDKSLQDEQLAEQTPVETKPAPQIVVPVRQPTSPQPIQTVQQQAPEKTKIQLPMDVPLDPEAWLQDFFQKFDLTAKFITFQIEKYKITHKFPHPKELLADLNELDSGSKLKRQNDLIVWFYETALSDYQNKMQRLSMPFDRPIIDFQPDPNRTGSSYTDRGISIERQNFPTADQFPRQTTTYSSEQQNELRELKAKVEQMQQEKFNEMANKMRDLEMKYEQAKTAPHQDVYQQKMEAKLEAMEAKTQELQQKLSEQAQMNLMNKFTELERKATAAPSMEMIQGIVQSAIEQDRTVKLRPEELEQRIKEIVNKEKTGITTEAVEMARIEKTYDLDKAKLDADRDKTGMWGETIKSVAAVFGESLGKGLAGGVQQPQPANPNMPPAGPLEQPMQDEPQVKTCPSCKKSMLFSLPPGVTVGQCPYCQTPLQISPTGNLVLFDIKQPIPQQKSISTPQPLEQPQTTNGNTLGICNGCGRPLYNYNIAETDTEGKQWCKTCRGANHGLP